MSKFLSNMITLSTSTLLGQVLGFLVTPIFSRLYSPADFGQFQLFVSIVGVIAPISCLSYFYAILLPEDEEDSAGVVVLCSFLITATVLAATIILYFSSAFLETVLHAPGFSLYLSLLPFGIGFSSFAYMIGYRLSKKEEFGTIAKANIYSSFTGKGITAGYGFISPSPFGLIVGSIVNDATICLIFSKKLMDDFLLFSRISYKKIWELASRYKKFPLYGMSSEFAGNAAVQVTPFLLALFFSPVVVGYYSMAYLILRLPSKLIGNALGTVFFQRASSEKNLTGGVKTVVAVVHTRLVSLGMFACLIVMITGPELFSFILGSKWATAGVYAQIFAPSFFVAFISTPLAYMYSVLEEQAASMWFNFLLLLSSVIALIVGGLLDNPVTGMILLSATGVIFYGWMNMYSLKISGVPLGEAGRELGKFFSISACFCLPLLVAKLFSAPPYLIIAFVAILSVLYYSVIVYNDDQLRTGFSGVVRGILGKVRK